jgi:hypothetical protein
VVIALGVMGCLPSHYAGKMNVDGRPFVPRTCKAGHHGKAYAVDLTDAEGRSVLLALAEEPKEKFPYLPPAASRPSVVSVKPSGAAEWEVVGLCGPLLLEQAPHRATFSGDARLACATEHHEVDGRLQFENCY